MYDLNITKPFGPCIIESQCPEIILNNLNSLVDNMDQSTKEFCSSKYSKVEGFPDLLSRGFEIIYLTPQMLEDTGFTQYISDIVPEYLKTFNVNSAEVSFLLSNFSEEFADVWVNRYYQNDYTPPHDHRGHISGITILDLPEDSDWYDIHSLEFIWNNEHHRPEQKIGKTFLFPSTLMHWVVKQKSLLERRTMSFNIAVNNPQQS
jgi:hypothetical protein